MLLHLDIQNLAIIDHVQLDFEQGMNVITGETGAGKSLLLSALDLVLGGRADRTMVRRGADRAVVQALFRVDATSSVAQRLAERELLEPGPSTEVDIVVRRIVTGAGLARASINGGLVTMRDPPGPDARAHRYHRAARSRRPPPLGESLADPRHLRGP